MSQEACEAFLNVADRFKLGTLETEKPHPRTKRLSQEIKEDLATAIESLKSVDVEALERFRSYIPELGKLGRDIQDTLESGGRIFLCGCGATGRLSISLEVFCRQGLVKPDFRERFVGFMAGGDAALIKSIENFEDYPDYGERQLLELGFSENDLLISTTEGGETPFVIGATEAAADTSGRKPWFLYCNPESQLIQEVERSRQVLENSGVQGLSLYVGSMGLSGSTRMQASTVLMAAVGWAIAYGSDTEQISERLCRFQAIWQQTDLSKLVPFIRDESGTYASNEYVIYETESFGVTVLTDTTERSPTFSLPPFENLADPTDPPAWCYLAIPSAIDIPSAWETILNRHPRCLDWEGIGSFASGDYLNGFHIDQTCKDRRKISTSEASQHPFRISVTPTGLRLQFIENTWILNIPELDFFEQNLLLKLILNTHSTLVMGVLERFESNLMTYVKPTNYKLIDRTIRYVQRISELRGRPVPQYREVAKRLFAIKDDLSPDEAVVIRLIEEA